MEFLYGYMVKGIIESGIREDGGEECYKEIPYEFAWMATISMTILHIFIFKLTKVQQHNTKTQPSTKL